MFKIGKSKMLTEIDRFVVIVCRSFNKMAAQARLGRKYDFLRRDHSRLFSEADKNVNNVKQLFKPSTKTT